MAEDKKVNDGNKDGGLTKKDRFEILLEHIDGKVDAIKEGHGILLVEIKEGNRKSEERDKELEDMMKSNSRVLHEKIDKVEAKLTEKINNVEVRLTKKIDGVDKRLANVEQDVNVLKQDVGVLKQDVGVLKQDVKKIDNKLDKIVARQDDQDVKIEKIAQKVFIEGAGF